MADDIKKSLKERSKLAESYYKNDQQKSDYNDVMETLLIVPRKSLTLKMITLIK